LDGGPVTCSISIKTNSVTLILWAAPDIMQIISGPERASGITGGNFNIVLFANELVKIFALILERLIDKSIEIVKAWLYLI